LLVVPIRTVLASAGKDDRIRLWKATTLPAEDCNVWWMIEGLTTMHCFDQLPESDP